MRNSKCGLLAAVSLCLAVPALGQQPTEPAAGKKDHVAAVKESLQMSAATLRQYQWVETTAVSLKGEEKSRTQNNCYYGADGKLQKTPIAAAPADDGKRARGVRGRVAENKKEEMSDAMKEAVALVKQYIPPDPDRIEAAKAAGRLSLTPPDAKGQIRIVIKDYLKAGDSLTLDANVSTDRVSGVTVSTFTDKAKDAVNLKVGMSAFADGTVFTEKVQLDIASQNLGVAIENTGYRKLNN